MQKSSKQPLNIILIGAPGSGKGTQCEYLRRDLQLAHLSTGDMLREVVKSSSEIGLKVQEIMARGELVDDEIVLQLVSDKFDSGACEEGFVLDGFPRTITQAEDLSRLLKSSGRSLNYVIYFEISDELLIERVSGRYIHQGSGRVYHIKYNPPKVAGIDDITGEPLIQRKDDNIESLKIRLTAFHEQTTPLLEYYQKLGLLKIIKAGLSPSEVRSQLYSILNKN
ncbi:adenylate kinase protein, putative [Cryptosporidium muris RN66]|uniref:Adenylate kinase protein, putative n=1 Tax=Cryptosporidium muris (strain RN66) TaxID=441375 RepID=B6ACH8_CRYMR|nr:adenylate kinase protein, putative [Cryptosporidium muris RN66]EEA05832.1 adenylate kinase protein, putative [Cryptosporidium muris RN66]|eukprot:XP_002140181.1 adenylate kinase protein [Cryptosporidium muris RN66]